MYWYSLRSSRGTARKTREGIGQKGAKRVSFLPLALRDTTATLAAADVNSAI